MRVRFLRCWGLVVGALGFSQPLIASEVFTGSLAATTFSHEAKENYFEPDYQRQEKHDYTFLSAGFCYSWSGFCLGAKIQLLGSHKVTYESTSDDSTTTVQDEFSGVGATIGYSGNSVVATYTMFLNPKKQRKISYTNNNGSTNIDVAYSAKSAYAIDLGYGFKLGSLRFGPLFSVYHFDYDKKKSSLDDEEVELKPREVDNFIMPHFAMWFDF